LVNLDIKKKHILTFFYKITKIGLLNPEPPVEAARGLEIFSAGALPQLFPYVQCFHLTRDFTGYPL